MMKIQTDLSAIELLASIKQLSICKVAELLNGAKRTGKNVVDLSMY